METKPCRYCKGTARITYRHPIRDTVHGHDCTSCNGTGIDGDPRGALVVLLLSALALCAFVTWMLG